MSVLASETQLDYVGIDSREFRLIQELILERVIKPKIKAQLVDASHHEINQTSEEFLSAKRKFLVIGMWSFTELSLEERGLFQKLIKNSQVAVFAHNMSFGLVENMEYLAHLSELLGKKMISWALPEILGPELPTYMKRHRVTMLV